MSEIRKKGIKKGWAIFWIILFILLFILSVIAFREGIISSDEIFHP